MFSIFKSKKKSKRRSSRPAYYSPPVSPNELSLNFKSGGVSRSSYWLTAPESEYFWNKPISSAEKIDQIFNRISERYRYVFGDCLVPFCLSIDIRKNPKSSIIRDIFTLPGKRFAVINWNTSITSIKKKYYIEETSEIDKNLKICINSSDLTAILLAVKKEGLHSMVVFIGRGTVEIHDPNGSNWHREEYGDEVEKVVREFLVNNFDLEYYNFYSIEETNLPVGFHSHNPDKYFNRGVCLLWSMYIIELRAKYFDKYPEPKKFARAVDKRLKKIIDYLDREYGQRNVEDELSKYLISYLFEFLSYKGLVDELSPKTPVYSDIIESYF